VYDATATAARHQRVPPGEVAALANEPVGAGFGEPCDRADGFEVDCKAVRDARVAVLIVLAAAACHVEEAAGEARGVDRAGVLVFELQEAAAAAAVAKALPLIG
jgi:hypothetical protein